MQSQTDRLASNLTEYVRARCRHHEDLAEPVHRALTVHWARSLSLIACLPTSSSSLPEELRFAHSSTHSSFAFREALGFGIVALFVVFQAAAPLKDWDVFTEPTGRGGMPRGWVPEEQGEGKDDPYNSRKVLAGDYKCDPELWDRQAVSTLPTPYFVALLGNTLSVNVGVNQTSRPWRYTGTQ